MTVELVGTVVGSVRPYRGGKGVSITLLCPLSRQQQDLAGVTYPVYIPVDVPREVLEAGPELRPGILVRVRGFLVALDTTEPVREEVARLLKRARVAAETVRHALKLLDSLGVDGKAAAAARQALEQARVPETVRREMDKLLARPRWVAERVILKVVAEEIAEAEASAGGKTP